MKDNNLLSWVVGRGSKMLRTVTTAGLFVAGALVCQAQNNSTESPYTRYGIGQMTNPVVTGARSMGGIGTGLRSKSITNPKNPASYTSVDSLTFIFDFGASISSAWYKDPSGADQRYLGNFEHATMLFPVTKYLAFSAGLLPYSQAGYEFGHIEQIEGAPQNDKYGRYYTGKGGITDIYIGLGIKPFANLSIGANVSYLYGSMSHYRRVAIQSPAPLNPMFLDNLKLKGLKMDFGVQYTHPLDAQTKRMITLGATYSPGLNMRSDLIKSHTVLGGNNALVVNKVDTVSSKDAYRLPDKFSLGATYEIKDKLLLGADFDYRLWQNAIYPQAECKFVNQWNVSLGGQYIPDESNRSFWSRTAYRFGVHGNNSYCKIPVQGERDLKGTYTMGLSVGMGMPLFDFRSHLNVGIEYNITLPEAKSMITENTVLFTMGLTFDEGWFRKLTVE